MFVLDGEIVFSASDLAAAARCEFAALRTLDGKLRPADAPETPPEDPVMNRAAELGLEHEARWLERLQADGRSIVTIERRRGLYRSREALLGAHDETIAAMRAGADVVYQGGFFDGCFHGWADFLVQQHDGSYAVYDTKLARRAKVTAVLQLAAYGDQLERAGIDVSPSMHLVLGSGVVTAHPYEEIAPVYRHRRQRLQTILDEHRSTGRNAEWDDERYSRCGRCPVCRAEVEAHDDLLLVAGLSTSQRSRLRAHGVRTVQDLADRVDSPPGMAETTFERLRAQAELQKRPEPTVDMHHPEAIEYLSPPSPNDIFLDLEGDPLWTSPDDPTDWGLEYLVGWVRADEDGTRRFHHLRADDRAAERRALQAFVDEVIAARRSDPTMHVYHYAPYEVTALQRLAGRYGTREEELDHLLRTGVFVDLLHTVRESVRTSAGSLGLKHLEPFYLDGHTREGVTSAAQSVAEYGDACALRDVGDLEGFAAAMQRIVDYNADDCHSTASLRDWLLALAAQRGHQPLGRARDADAYEDEARVDHEVHDVAHELLRLANSSSCRDDDATAYRMLAAALEFHRREERPFWRAHHDRLGTVAEDWTDARDTFVAAACSQTPAAVSVADPAGTIVGTSARRLVLHGAAQPGSSLRSGGTVWTLYKETVPGRLPDGVKPSEGTPRGWNANECEIESLGTAACGCDEAVVLEYGRVAKSAALPYALAPLLIRSGPLKHALVALGRSVADGGELPRSPAIDILRRSEPRLLDGRRLHDDDPARDADAATSLTRALLDCDDSYIAVQGPPGTGKTFTAASVVAALVRDHGWRVGVVAQSHAVVENLLGRLLDAGLPRSVVGKKRPSSGPRGGFTWLDTKERDEPGAMTFADFYAQERGLVLGGTAWDFVNRKRLPGAPLDLLVIEEAGQFSLANTLAVSRAARRLLLLGDPQQLPQVTQGTHPAPVDTSALGWITDGRRTLPSEYGFFLDRTWRMHPALCAVDSALAYDGRLESSAVAGERSLDGVPAGLRTLLVPHTTQNRTSSVEEAQVVLHLVTDLLDGGRLWRDPDESGPRPLAARDVIVVAPYNAQVAAVRQLLTEAGHGAVRVGTVDKFQGQEAAVCIVTLAATSAVEVPRGLPFLVNRNRLNVAISRAKHHAVLVHSPDLYDHLPTNPVELPDFGAFVRLSTSGLPQHEEISA